MPCVDRCALFLLALQVLGPRRTVLKRPCTLTLLLALGQTAVSSKALQQQGLMTQVRLAGMSMQVTALYMVHCM
jgi:hypothetical protein